MFITRSNLVVSFVDLHHSPSGSCGLQCKSRELKRTISSYTESWRNLRRSEKRARRDEAPHTLACHPFQPQRRPSRRAHRAERARPHLQVDSFTCRMGHILRTHTARRVVPGSCAAQTSVCVASRTRCGAWFRGARSGMLAQDCERRHAIQTRLCLPDFPACMWCTLVNSMEPLVMQSSPR